MSHNTPKTFHPSLLSSPGTTLPPAQMVSVLFPQIHSRCGKSVPPPSSICYPNDGLQYTKYMSTPYNTQRIRQISSFYHRPVSHQVPAKSFPNPFHVARYYPNNPKRY